MMSIQDLTSHTGEQYGPVAPEDRRPWVDSVTEDLEKELRPRTPLQEILAKAAEDAPRETPKQPLRTALSAIREDLDKRTREWRGSAKVVEQTLRQLVAAEQERAAALDELARVEARVVRTGEALTQALASFDETGESKNLDPRFAESEQALQDLDRVANDLAITQHCCRAAWKAYEEALANEQDLRIRIRSSAA